MSVDLVIFDCDGVLVDSEPISVAVLRDVVAEAGVVIPEALAYERFLGRSMASIARMLETDFGVERASDLLDRMRTRLYERFRAELRPIAGVAEALGALDRPFCVASSSQPERIRLSLEITGLLAFFGPRIYSSTMVANGKPAPDLFLHAAASMGAAPANCVVVEDSPAGIQAARRAGMRALAFQGGGHMRSAALRAAAISMNPDGAFDDMRDLPGLIADAVSG